MISPTMHTRWHSICVCVFFLGGHSETPGLGLSGGSNFNLGGHILKLSDLDSLSNFNFGGGVFCMGSVYV